MARPIHSWKAGPGDVMTGGKIFIITREATKITKLSTQKSIQFTFFQHLGGYTPLVGPTKSCHVIGSGNNSKAELSAARYDSASIVVNATKLWMTGKVLLTKSC